MTTSSEVDADLELKQRQRRMWATGNYPAVATEVVPRLGPVLVEAAGVRAGQRVLDVAAGTGNASIPAALTGADVIASDLTPELLDAGRRLADRRGASLTWREADAEALPFEDGSFDVVLSCIGVMFAPHHQRAADELVRVCRPGGTVGLLSWTPGGFVGRMLGAMRPFVPPPPPGAQPPPLWGDETHVRELLGDRVADVRTTTAAVPVDRFASPEAFLHFWREAYGPTVAAYRAIGDDAERSAALDAALTGLARSALRPAPHGQGAVMDWEYLVLVATRR